MRAANILKECTEDYENVSCNVIEPYIRGVPLPYVLTCRYAVGRLASFHALNPPAIDATLV